MRKARDETSWEGWCQCLLRTRNSKHSRRHPMAGDITVAWLLEKLQAQDYKCALTQLPLLHQHGNPRSCSIDRIDSALPYTRENIQLINTFANLGKNGYQQDDIRELLDEIRGEQRTWHGVPCIGFDCLAFLLCGAGLR